MAPAVAAALARLGERETWTGDDDLVFPARTGGYLDGSALRRRYKAALERAGLRPLRFHDLRHTFGTRMIAKADIRRVQEWMGHADVQTTMQYLHYAPRAEDARAGGGGVWDGDVRREPTAERRPLVVRRCRRRADMDAKPAEGGADVKRASQAAARRAIRARLTSATTGAKRMLPSPPCEALRAEAPMTRRHRSLRRAAPEPRRPRRCLRG